MLRHRCIFNVTASWEAAARLKSIARAAPEIDVRGQPLGGHRNPPRPRRIGAPSRRIRGVPRDDHAVVAFSDGPTMATALAKLVPRCDAARSSNGRSLTGAHTPGCNRT